MSPKKRTGKNTKTKEKKVQEIKTKNFRYKVKTLRKKEAQKKNRY